MRVFVSIKKSNMLELEFIIEIWQFQFLEGAISRYALQSFAFKRKKQKDFRFYRG